ncbi:MAG TPA: PKD domain-containing protein, partial [Ardenticatenaceae bacterium]
LSDTDTAQVTVSNVAPTVEAGANRTTSEGILVRLAPATFNDKGTRDTHTSTINWGDGTATEAGTVTETPFGPPGSTAGANGSVAGSHVYADNGTYTVQVCVTDDDAATACDTLNVTANNAAPRVYGGADRAASEGQLVSFPNVGFTDKGTLDTHTATINWGDGTATEAGTVTETPFGPPGSVSGATGRVAGSHVYADNGTYTVEFCVTDDDGAKTCDTVLMTINNVAPRVFGGGDFAANEGQLIRFTNVVITDKGTLDTHTATINWGDGTATEAGTVTETPFGPPGSTSGMTGKIAGSHVYADNGSYSVEFCATDDDGGRACDTVVITVRNVAPTVNAGPDQTLNEGDTSTLALARFNDKGTLDTHTATINWGDGTQVNATVTESPFGPPGSTAGANGTVSGSHIYGDNGTYTVNVCVTDDDGAKTCDTIVVTVNNVNPVLTLDKTGAVSTAGGLAFLGRRYVPQTHSATASDAGSDDLRFDWTFLPHTATDRTTYYNNGTSPDPLPSPGGTFPFSVTDTATVTFPRAGVFTVAVSVRDDDGGTDSESLMKLVTDSGSCTASHGTWRQQFSGKGNSLYPQATLLAYLDITTFASGVFSEMAPAGTIAQAQAILQPSGADVGDPHPSNMKGKATQELLAAWLNFAKGGIGWNTRLASGKSFSQTIYQIEAIIFNPTSTHNDFVQAKNLAQSINNHGCS